MKVLLVFCFVGLLLSIVLAHEWSSEIIVNEPLISRRRRAATTTLNCKIDAENKVFRIDSLSTSGQLQYRKTLSDGWGSVCGTDFYAREAMIICRYICDNETKSDQYATRIAKTIQNPAALSLEKITCPETATQFRQCPLKAATQTSSCDSWNYVSIRCGAPEATPLPPRTSPTLFCGKTQAIVTFNKNDAYQSIDSVDRVTLENKPDNGCEIVKNLNDTIFKMSVPYGGCNITNSKNDTHYTYEFSIKRNIAAEGGIINKPSYTVLLRCHFPINNSGDGSGGTDNSLVTEATVNAQMVVNMELELYLDALYTTKLVAGNSITIGSQLYVRATASRVTGTVVNVQNCFLKQPKTYLIRNRCPETASVKISYYSGSETRFHFPAFSNATTTVLDIYCDALRCHASEGCQKGC